MRNWFRLLLASLTLAFANSARAEVVVGFYNYELELGLVTHFPHVFVTMKGTTSDGRVIDENIGFTAKSVTPAVLTGWVKGMTESKDEKYIAESERQFEVKVSDAQYEAIKKIAEEWKALPGKSYNLSKRNCIHFVGAIGTMLGLQVDLGKGYVKKPRAFLQRILALNPQLVPLIPPKATKKSGK